MKRMISLICGCLLLTGCGDRKAELEQYVAEVKSKSIGQIEPLPEVKPYETFRYQAQLMRSPFEPQIPQESVLALPESNGIRPDAHRRKEALEGFELDELRMVGTLEQRGAIWGIIVDTDGAVHRVSEGNFAGQNHGKITSVTEEQIKITEIIPDGMGGWRERDASMTLIE